MRTVLKFKKGCVVYDAKMYKVIVALENDSYMTFLPNQSGKFFSIIFHVSTSFCKFLVTKLA